MKRGLVAFALLLASAGTAWADGCRSDQRLAVVGTAQTDDAVVVTRAVQLRLISLSCGASACNPGLYDETSLSSLDTADIILEPSAAANAGVLVPESGFFEQPIEFTRGVVFVDDGNVNAITLFECVQR